MQFPFFILHFYKKTGKQNNQKAVLVMTQQKLRFS